MPNKKLTLKIISSIVIHDSSQNRENTFEQSEINAEDKYRFLTNWKSFQCNGFTIPGVKEKHDWCGIWNTKGCLHAEDHIQP